MTADRFNAALKQHSIALRTPSKTNHKALSRIKRLDIPRAKSRMFGKLKNWRESPSFWTTVLRRVLHRAKGDARDLHRSYVHSLAGKVTP